MSMCYELFCRIFVDGNLERKIIYNCRLNQEQLQKMQLQLAIPKLMSGLGTSVKKCPNKEMNPITKKTTSKLVSIQSLKMFT